MIGHGSCLHCGKQTSPPESIAKPRQGENPICTFKLKRRCGVRRKPNRYSIPHARDEMRNENFDERDVINCFLTGSIIEDPYDGDRKYIWQGEALDGRDISLVTRFTYGNNVFVITVFWTQLFDYE